MKVINQYMLSVLVSVLCIMNPHTVVSQKIMQLPPGLNDQYRLDVTMINNLKFFQFSIADYRVVSGKNAWTKRTQSGNGQIFISQLISRSEVVNQEEKGSFIMTNAKNDSTIVNTATNTSLLYNDASNSILKFLRTEKEYKVGMANFIATIETTLDTNKWVLTTVQKETYKGQTLGWDEYSTSFQGWLTNGEREIHLKEVKYFANGKKPLYSGLLGLVFIENEEPIFAIQFYTASMKKNSQFFVWIDPTQASAMQSVLIPTAAALLGRDLQMRAETIESSASDER